MVKVCVIGGTGHIGRFLVPMLVREGYRTIVVGRGQTPPPKGEEWEEVELVSGTYQPGDAGWKRLLEEISPDITIDILGTDAPNTYEAIRPFAKHFILCGSLWMYGEPKIVLTPEVTQSPCIFPGYAKRYAEMLELKERAKKEGIKFTAIMPPNICGPGKIPLEGWGGRSLEVHLSHMKGKPVPLPLPGEALIGPCDAEDVAQGFLLAVLQEDASADEIFNVGSAYALTAKQFIATYGEIYHVEIPIEWYSWEEYEKLNPDVGSNYHFRTHMCPDISKIGKKLDYQPRYTPEESMERAVAWMRGEGLI